MSEFQYHQPTALTCRRWKPKGKALAWPAILCLLASGLGLLASAIATGLGIIPYHAWLIFPLAGVFSFLLGELI